MKGILLLEDGTLFEGISQGAQGERIGEVILNTAVVGYQEMMTDPANAGKILVFTYPLIGNYGVAKKFYESKKCWVEAIIIKEKSRMYSNWQAEDSFDNFLKKEDVVAISDIDTRTLAVHIREQGQMLGIASTKQANKEALLKKLKNYKKSAKRDFIKDISVKKIIPNVELQRSLPSGSRRTSKEVSAFGTEIKTGRGPNIAIMDLGILNSFIKQLKTLGCNIALLPYNISADKILSLDADGLIISNGPEEDAAIPQIVDTVKKIIGKIPILGISLGHEIIALSLGGKLKKLKIGHHGVNYPVKSPSSYKGEITVQNHSFAADEDSIKNKKGVKITLYNINDNTIEEMESDSLKFISTQYYPSSPGFDEVNGAFKRFLKMTDNKERKLACQSAKI